MLRQHPNPNPIPCLHLSIQCFNGQGDDGLMTGLDELRVFSNLNDSMMPALPWSSSASNSAGEAFIKITDKNGEE